MYYRLAKWYSKYEKFNKISYSASILVSLSQVLSVLILFGVLLNLFFEDTEKKEIMSNLKLTFIVIVIIVSFINDRIYFNKYNDLNEKWMNQTENEKEKYGYMVIALVIGPVLLIPLFVFIFNLF